MPRFGVRDLCLGCGLFLAGLGAAIYLHWPALANYAICKEDILQSPHWAAYHTSSFRDDDLVLLYASFNESPLQNAIYWVATWVVDFVTLTKVLAVISYGLLSLTFFVIGRAMYGLRFGLLLSLFITFLPDQWEFSAGFFSKFWAIPLLLACVFFLQTERTMALIGLLPFAAIAYPTAAVLIGMTASVHWVQEFFRSRSRARTLLLHLAIGSAVAIGLLMLKYTSPPEAIGAMRPGGELRAMPELQAGGYFRNIPIPPLHAELLDLVGHPFLLLSAVLYLLVLGREGVRWDRSWTALFLASAIGYAVADHFFMRFYVPNRYTRYSMPVLLALWNARNWDLMLARLRSPTARCVSVLALLAAGGYAYSVTFEHGKGWTDKRNMAPVSRFIRQELPGGVLFAGSPRRLDDVMIQARRSVLCPYKLAHPWFTRYYDEIRERTRATLRAHFAAGPGPINELHRRWGVTHFLVQKSLFKRARNKGRVFANPYNDEVQRELAGRQDFYLDPPPPALVLWQDERFAVVRLPLPIEETDADHARP